jgi:hypothetical protein
MKGDLKFLISCFRPIFTLPRLLHVFVIVGHYGLKFMAHLLCSYKELSRACTALKPEDRPRWKDILVKN